MTIKFNTSLRPPPCEEAPHNGLPVMIGRHGQTSATTQMTGSGISSGAVSSDHLHRALIRQILGLGGGRDGEADFDGTSTVQGLAPSGGVYTLTKELDISRCHVRSGAVLKMDGYRFFSAELHLWDTAIIHRDGESGSGVNKGAALGGGNMLGGSVPGGDAGLGGTGSSAAGSPGSAGSDIGSAVFALGGDGGASGAGQASAGAGGAGAAGGVVQTVADVSVFSLDNMTRLHRHSNLDARSIYGGAGGAGGGGGGSGAGGGDIGGNGTGGSSGGGVCLVVADEIVLHDWIGRISANGGTATNPGDSVNGDGGGGGGGGGGFVQVVCRKVTGGALIASPTARGTASTTRLFTGNSSYVTGGNVQANGGDGGNSPTNDGTAGAGGTANVIVFEQPFVPTPEIPRFSKTQPSSRPPRLHAGHYAAMAHRSPTE